MKARSTYKQGQKAYDTAAPYVQPWTESQDQSKPKPQQQKQ